MPLSSRRKIAARSNRAADILHPDNIDKFNELAEWAKNYQCPYDSSCPRFEWPEE